VRRPAFALALALLILPSAVVLLSGRDLAAQVDAGTEAGTSRCMVTVSGALSATLPCQVTYLAHVVTIGILADGGPIRAPASSPEVHLWTGPSVPNVGLSLFVTGGAQVGRANRVEVVALVAIRSRAMWSLRTTCGVDGGSCALDLTHVSTTTLADGGAGHEWHGTFKATLADTKNLAPPVTLSGVF
jgi:hypothetical protein